MLFKGKVLSEPIKRWKENSFLNLYIIRFLNFPSNFEETDLEKSHVSNVKDFVIAIVAGIYPKKIKK